jgi:hypothetical protein
MEKRITKILVDGEWKTIQFSELKPGDIFKLFDDKEESIPVIHEGHTEFVATSVPYKNANQVLTVEYKFLNLP